MPDAVVLAIAVELPDHRIGHVHVARGQSLEHVIGLVAVAAFEIAAAADLDRDRLNARSQIVGIAHVAPHRTCRAKASIAVVGAKAGAAVYKRARPILRSPQLFAWARGFARRSSLLPPLDMRGVTRRDDALSGLRRTARTITPGGPGSPGPGASADAPRQLGAPRGISGFTPSTDRSDRPAVLVPREGSPPPPGDVALRWPRSRVPHPVPPSRRLMRAPLDGRDLYHLR